MTNIKGSKVEAKMGIGYTWIYWQGNLPHLHPYIHLELRGLGKGGGWGYLYFSQLWASLNHSTWKSELLYKSTFFIKLIVADYGFSDTNQSMCAYRF